MSTATSRDDGAQQYQRFPPPYASGTPDWGALADASADHVRRRMTLAGAAVAAAATGVPIIIGLASNDTQSRSVEPIDLTPFMWVAAGLLAILVVAVVLYLITRRQYMANQNKGFTAKLKAQEEYHQQALEKLRKTTELATLMELNQGQIGEYHRIVTDQADKAFRSSRTAMGVGLFLLVCAAFGGVYVPLEEIRWFIAALAAFSTLLSGYLSRTYMILYRESITQLNRYFDQPVLNSYYLTAERLTQSLDREHVVEIRRQIINEVLATSSRLGAKGADTASAAASAKPKLPKNQAAKKRGSKQGAPSQNGRGN
ncbi:hypothetical protein [Streptomyces phaeochromogenes]|uniref:hypothetical protein n=1 Tax=Streptomyces phaeochromogenes TaxID=1923 RepID=UPI00386637BD|nr:hypothetical protein OG277_33150 [Streptomyces phaeochromogenes]